MNEKQTLLFTLNISDNRDPKSIQGETDKSLPVYSKELRWEPREGQENFLFESSKPVFDNILITKLRPGDVT